THASRPARALHRPTHVACRADRPRVPRPVERRGALSALEEGRRSPLGTILPVGRRIAPASHLRYGARADPGQLGEDRAAHVRFGAGHDGEPRRHPRDPGPDDDGRGWATPDVPAGPRVNRGTAPRSRRFWPGPLDAQPFFM